MFRRTVQGLSARVPPPADAVLYGPRGNGKTSLLAWLAAEAKAVRGVDALYLDPSEIPDTTTLAARLTRRSFRRPFAPAEATVRGVTSQRFPGEGPRLLRETLERRVRRRGLVLLFDEAHTLPPEVGRSLLTVSQQVRFRGLRFLLVLAGTPDSRPARRNRRHLLESERNPPHRAPRRRSRRASDSRAACRRRDHDSGRCARSRSGRMPRVPLLPPTLG